MTNFVLVVVSLLGCSAGACLLAFYQIHLLTFISVEFVIVPLVLIGTSHIVFTANYKSRCVVSLNCLSFFSSVKRKRGFVMGLYTLLYHAHTQQEEESAALENALSQLVKIRSPDFRHFSEFPYGIEEPLSICM